MRRAARHQRVSQTLPDGPGSAQALISKAVAAACMVLGGLLAGISLPRAAPVGIGLSELRAQRDTAAAQVPIDDAEAILERFTTDYEADPSLKRELTFAVVLNHDHWWHVVARPADGTEPANVELVRGRPAEPTFFFTLDYETLRRIDRGQINALTAMVRGLQSDAAPMGTGGMDGFRPPEGLSEIMLDVGFHFWTRGFPEVVPFGEEHTRLVHGADAAVLFYQPGFRSGWFSLKPGQHANADPRLQVNPFPTLLIVTKGRGAGRIGEREMEIGAGHAVFIPAGVAHEFWNPHDEPAEGFLLMFGPGA